MAAQQQEETQDLKSTLDFLGQSVALDTERDLRNARDSLRLFALVIVVSAAMGVAAWAFLLALDTVSALREAQPLFFLLLPPVAVGTAWIYHNYGKRSSKGNNLVIHSALHGGLIRARMAVLTFCCSVATHLAGGSAGREGAAVQIGGTIASNVSTRFKLGQRDHRDLMLAGIAAAFGGMFGTPLAGAFFGMEMCFVGKLEYSAAVYCLIGSFTGDYVSQLLGSEHAFQRIAHVPSLDWQLIAAVAAAAVVFGLVARFFSFAIRTVKAFYAARFSNYLVRALVGSLVLLAAYALCNGWDYAGLAEWMVEAGFKGQTSPVDALLKLIYTALTVGAGFQGGEVTPLFGMGASIGGWIGETFVDDPSFMAAMGVVAMFGAALNVPVTAIMLGVDMFGGGSAPYYVIAAFVSYLVAGHRGLYAAQRIVTPKRRSLSEDESLTVGDAIERHHQEVEEVVVELADEDADEAPTGDEPAAGPATGPQVAEERKAADAEN